jgi:hypothetical protein
MWTEDRCLGSGIADSPLGKPHRSTMLLFGMDNVESCPRHPLIQVGQDYGSGELSLIINADKSALRIMPNM